MFGVIRLGMGGPFGPGVDPVVRTGIFIILVIGHVDARKIPNGLVMLPSAGIGGRKASFCRGGLFRRCDVGGVKPVMTHLIYL